MITLTTTSAGTLQSRANRTVRSFMGRSLQPHHISSTGWALLGVVAKTPAGVRPSTAAEELGVKRPMITQLIREFESRDLVKSIADTSDTRAKKIILTPHGYKFVEMLEIKLREDLSGFLGDVPIDELTTYFRILRKIAGKLDT